MLKLCISTSENTLIYYLFYAKCTTVYMINITNSNIVISNRYIYIHRVTTETSDVFEMDCTHFFFFLVKIEIYPTQLFIFTWHLKCIICINDYVG